VPPARRAVIVAAAISALCLVGGASLAWASDAKYRTFRPAGAGPHPAAALVSGCDGFAPALSPTLYERRAERLRALGHVVIFVDYLGPRGLRTCAGPVTHDDAARDLLAATAWLRSQPAVDHTRITAMGWSYGARAVLVALTRHTGGDRPFSRAVVHYPDCRALQLWKQPVPVLMLLGGDDDMTPAKLCQEALTRPGAPAAVKIVVYPGALHAFDVPELPARMRYGLATIGYNPAAAAAAQKEIEQFLRVPR